MQMEVNELIRHSADVYRFESNRTKVHYAGGCD
jgi:hypothetical protein